jgi:hypothetical protein
VTIRSGQAPERSASAGRGVDARVSDRVHLVLTNRTL